MRKNLRILKVMRQTLLSCIIALCFALESMKAGAETFTAKGLPLSIPDGGGLVGNCWSNPGVPLNITISVSVIPGNITSAIR